jgi:multiple sugar transport system ATP-binding protein
VASITFEHVGKVYRNGARALTDLSLEIEDGEFMVFVGPSGCGKTTALRMVAGLEEVTEGTIRIGDTVANDLHPGKRDIAMVFQNYALYPHMTIFENLAFPLRSRKVPRSEIPGRVEKVAAMLELTDLLQRKPRTLSGGQRQRVAMGRAVVREPQAFLMDEPLSNLDAKLRVQMRGEISRIQANLGVTTIYVTHDQVEAMTMGSRIAVMRLGVLQQQAPPQEMYDHPTNLFVATFIGSPGMNLVKGRIIIEDGAVTCRLGDQDVVIPASVLAERPALTSYSGKDVALGLRPEHLGVASIDAEQKLYGRIVNAELLGAEQLLHASIDAERVVTDAIVEIAADTDPTALSDLGGESGESRVTLVARADPSFVAERGAKVALGLVTSKLHFFDLDTGDAIH